MRYVCGYRQLVLGQRKLAPEFQLENKLFHLFEVHCQTVNTKLLVIFKIGKSIPAKRSCRGNSIKSYIFSEHINVMTIQFSN